MMWILSTCLLLPAAIRGEPPARLVLEDHDHLPLGFASAVLEGLGVAYHDDSSLAFAWYQPALDQAPRTRGFAPDDPGSTESTAPASRLWLSREVFAAAKGRLRIGELPIDVVENLVFALLLARLHGEVEDGSEVGRWLRNDAAQRETASQNADDELAATMMAVASFGSYLVSVANEVERLDRRSRGRGDRVRGKSVRGDHVSGERGVCQVIRDRVGIFLVWERAFGREFPTSAFAGRGETLRAVAVDGQRLVVEKVLGASWTGDALHDFGPRYCRGVREEK